jgi:dienelactone hydrolase
MSASNGTARPAGGALFLPSGRAPAGGWPIMAFDHGTSGMGPGCGGMSDPATAPFPADRREQDQLIGYFVAKGFAVVAPDYLGLGMFQTGPHPYLELKSEATATLDLVRAARAAHPELSRTWAVVGASQGGQAALGTGYLQQEYTPDLDFRGTIAIDPESDLEDVLPVGGPWVPGIPAATGSGTTAFIAMTLLGLRETRPDVNVNGYLSPQGRSVVDSIGTLCLDKIIDRVQGMTVGGLLSRQLPYEPFRAALTNYMAVPAAGYNAPILLLVNATDTTVPSPLHAALITQLAAGHVDFRTVVGTGDHTQLNPEMHAALDSFVAGILSTPTRP